MDAYRDEIRKRVLKADVMAWLVGEFPPAVAIASAPVIDQWEVTWAKMEPGGSQMRLTGIVSGRKNMSDGDTIRTTEVVLLDRKVGWALTSNTLYRLGDHAGIEIPITGWWS